MRRRLIPAASCLILLLLACAKQGMPPGGPVDKTPPEVTGSMPASGSVRIGPRPRISLTFSEAMNRESVEGAVFLSPRQEGDPAFRWKKNTLTVSLAGSLAVPGTYTLTVGTDASDLRGNRLAASFSLALATGDSIAQGAISGTVFDAAGTARPALVGAYALDDTVIPDPSARQPEFITQADAEGRYRIPYLADGTYRLLAFTDKNRDGLFTVGSDIPGASVADPVISGGGTTDGMDLVLAPFDTAAPAITAVQPVSQTRLGVRFSVAPDPLSIDPAGITLTGRGGGVPVRAVVTDDDNTKKLTVICDPLVPDSIYTLAFTGLTNTTGKPADGPVTALFTAAGAEDSLGPKVTGYSPEDSARGILPDAAVLIRFNEPPDTSRPVPLVLREAGGTAVSWRTEWRSPLEFAAVPETALAGNRYYTVRLGPASLADYGGNTGPDSLLTFTFRTVPDDTLGTVTGTLAAEKDSAGNYLIRLKGPGRLKDTRELVRKGPGRFAFSGLLPGSYRVFAFRDDNGNGRHDPGCLLPFRPAEPFRRPALPVEVRAQWDVEGLVIRF